MSIMALMAIELALVVIGLGFLVQSQSNSAISNVVAAILILGGLICGMYTFSQGLSNKVPSVDLQTYDNKR